MSYEYSFTPEVKDGYTTTEINLFPVTKIQWTFYPNVTYAGKIDTDTTLFFENIQKQDTVKLTCRWVNKTIDGKTINEYFLEEDNGEKIHKRYGTLKLKDKKYKAVMSLPITEIPVAQGRAQEVTITFTIVENAT